MTEQEYLTIERASEFKSEFLNGEMIAISGCTTAHSMLQVDITVALAARLQDSPCDVLSSDHRLKVVTTGLYAYPDATVVRGAIEYSETHAMDTLVNPTVIFEVLSPSTESYDRGVKFFHYRRIPSLTNFVLVSQNEMLVELHTKIDESSWHLHTLTKANQELTLTSLGITIPLEEIYRRIKFAA